MRKTSLFLAFIAVLMSFVFSHSISGQVAVANQNDIEYSGNCNAVDMVLLIDHSKSMGNVNDREGFRIIAAQDFVQRLAENALLECPGVLHRLAIGNFGTGFEWINFDPTNLTTINWVEIGNYNNITEIDDWQKKYVDPIRDLIRAQDLKDTEIITPTQKAAELLKEMSPIEGFPRKKVVILITDGLPSPTAPNLDQYMQRLKDGIDEKYPYHDPASPDDIFFWVVGLDASGEGITDYLTVKIKIDNTIITVEQFWTGVSQTHGGDFVKLTENKNEIPFSLNQIYAKIMGIDGKVLPCEKAFYIDPYTQRAVFTFIKNKPGLGVTLEYLPQDSANQIRITSGQVFNEQQQIIEDFRETNGQNLPDGTRPLIKYWSEIRTVERYQINRPPAGTWFIRSLNCPAIRAIMEPLKASAEYYSPRGPLPTVADEPYYDINFPAYFQIRIFEQDGTPFSVDPLYPINVTITYTDQKGETVLSPSGSSTWELKPIGNGIWQCPDPILVRESGTYSVAYRGLITPADPEQREQKILFEGADSFQAVDKFRLGFSIISPQDGKILPYNDFESGQVIHNPITVTVKLEQSVGKTRQALDPTGILLSSKPFMAELLESDSNSVIKQFYLEPTDKLNGILQGTIDVDTVATLKPEIKYRVIVHLDSELNDKWLSINDKAETSFILSRRDSFQFEFFSPEGEIRLHNDFLSACPPQSKPASFRIGVRILNLEGTKQLEPADLLAAGQKPEQLLFGELVPPLQEGEKQLSASLPYTFTFKLDNDPDGSGKVWIVDTGDDIEIAGIYMILVSANQDILNSKYIAPQRPSEYTFVREDDIMTNPRTCQTAMGATGILVILVMIGIIIAMTGGPGGMLVFEGRDAPPPLKLSRARILSTIRGKELQTYGIKKIKATRGISLPMPSSDGESTVASSSVHVIISNMENDPIFEQDLMDMEPALPVPLGEDQEVEVRYQKSLQSP